MLRNYTRWWRKNCKIHQDIWRRPNTFVQIERGIVMAQKKILNLMGLTAILLVLLLGLPFKVSAISIGPWSGVGGYGALGADGVVTLSPYGDAQYGYVTTTDGLPGVGSLPGAGGSGSPTNGSTITSPTFASNAGDTLEFYFNYVTSDGAGFADYAWAKLTYNGTTELVLFTARTTPGGDTVPGFSMPPIASGVTLTPTSTAIIPGGPLWSPLGSSSGGCWDTGCGYTDWVKATYEIPTTGNYLLEFGVTNWNDQAYNSGMAFDGATIAGKPIEGVPEPATMLLIGAGLIGLAGFSRRRIKSN
jgi:hypothetical protein